MSLIDSLSAPADGNPLKGWTGAAQAPVRHLNGDKPWRPEPLAASDGILSAAAFLEQIDSLARDAARDEAMRALVSIKPSEVRALVTQVAKTKGRYLAALLESSGKATGKEDSIVELQRLRRRYEELSAGLEQLRAMILEGEIEVEGVGF